jgi:hypothetical protein
MIARASLVKLQQCVGKHYQLSGLISALAPESWFFSHTKLAQYFYSTAFLIAIIKKVG